jgi:hypothetical protein
MEPPVDYSLFPRTSMQGYLQANNSLPPGHQERTISYPNTQFSVPSDSNLSDASAPMTASSSNIPNPAARSKPMRSVNMYTVLDAPLLFPLNYPTASSTATDIIQGSDHHHHNESSTGYYNAQIPSSLHPRPAYFRCKWEGCRSSTNFRREGDLIRHLRTIHISPNAYIPLPSSTL